MASVLPRMLLLAVLPAALALPAARSHSARTAPAPLLRGLVSMRRGVGSARGPVSSDLARIWNKQVQGASRCVAELSRTSAYASRFHAAPTGKPGQVLEEGDNVVVMGALDPTGREIIRLLQEDGRYQISTLLNPNIIGGFRNRYGAINAVDASDAENAKKLLLDASAVIMSFEKPADTDTLRYLLGYGAEGETALKRFVLLSKVGVTRKGQFGMAFFKNLLGKELDKYSDLEELLQKGADALKVDYTVVRSGNLRLGPDTFMNPDSLAVAEEQLFETTKKKVVLSKSDETDGDSSRTDVAEAIVESLLRRPEAANKIFSVLNEKGSKDAWDGLFAGI